MRAGFVGTREICSGYNWKLTKVYFFSQQMFQKHVRLASHLPIFHRLSAHCRSEMKIHFLTRAFLVAFCVQSLNATEPPLATESSNQAQSVSFDHDVMSVLSKAGCNAGTCHGNINGKGGFLLSLRGQDPDFDFQQLVHASRGRRVNPFSPSDSLLLLKATSQVAHEGGKRFSDSSPE